MSYKNKNSQKGFTMIELMVVISIIGTLSSTILATLNNTRNQAKNARIQQLVNQLKTQIELGYDGSYYTNLKPNISSVAGASALGAFGTQINLLVGDILVQNPGSSYGGTSSGGSSCFGAAIPYFVSSNSFQYEPNGTGGQFAKVNGLTIFTSTSVCSGGIITPTYAKKYAIYAAYTPLTVAGGPGYYCLDSSGKSSSVKIGYIPYYNASLLDCSNVTYQ